MDFTEKRKDILSRVLIECSSCNNREVLLSMLETDHGWGYYELRGVTVWECADCAGEDDEDDD